MVAETNPESKRVCSAWVLGRGSPAEVLRLDCGVFPLQTLVGVPRSHATLSIAGEDRRLP